ncbi:hypothetical protein NSPZN2_40236 [Nitrospira defluvii]|uniref:Uncharacterized protein n=1 Tax=Nitrospira defluvii TaxID=330214 RepID=A0ABM8RT45_9BACT|nr:hypothetical protein NSPZN2_40236 [Nitrospira defluvii]
MQGCEKLFWVWMTTRRCHHSGAVCRLRYLDRDVRRPVIAFEDKIDRRLLAGMELVDDVAVTLLSVLKRLQARDGAIDGEVDSFEDGAFSDAVRRVNRIYSIDPEPKDERVAVIVDSSEAFDGQFTQEVTDHDLSPVAAF